jgi:MerR family mercuric resistance operon transcriptional regulator
VERVQFIKRAQELGFSLSEIKELLSLPIDDEADSGHVRELAQAKIADIEEKIRTLSQDEGGPIRAYGALLWVWPDK